MATSQKGKQPDNSAKKPATRKKEAGIAASGRKRVDWDAVERDYRTTHYTDGELAELHGVTREAIVRRRRKDQAIDHSRWARDLAPHVRAATNALLMQESIADAITDGHSQVTGTVLAAAEVNKQVILGHRQGLQALTDVKRTLLSQIEQAAAQLPDLAEVIEMVRKPDDNGIDRANDALRKAMSRSALVDDLKKLADVDEKVRKGEREAFGLDDDPAKKPPGDDQKKLSDVELALRVANLMAKAGAA